MLPIGDKLLPGFGGPAQELAPANLRDRQLTHLVASQLQCALATDALVGWPLLVLLVVLGERGEPIDYLKHRQEALRRLDALKAAGVLVVLVEPADHQFHGIVGPFGRAQDKIGDDLASHGVHQLGPASGPEAPAWKVPLQAAEYLGRSWHRSHIPIAQGYDLGIPPLGGALVLALEDAIDGLFQSHCFRVFLCVVSAIDPFDLLLRPLQGVEDAFMVGGLGEHLRHRLTEVPVQIGDNHPQLVPFGLELQQEGPRPMRACAAEEFHKALRMVWDESADSNNCSHPKQGRVDTLIGLPTPSAQWSELHNMLCSSEKISLRVVYLDYAQPLFKPS